VTIDSHTTPSRRGPQAMRSSPELVLCAVDDAMARAWRAVPSKRRSRVRVHRGSVLDIEAHAVVSPANSQGWMRGGIDAIYSRAFPEVEQRVRSAILTYHGGELPVGQAVAVPTGESMPAWLISAPTMRQPGERLPPDTVHPYLAARAVFEFWRDRELEHGLRACDAIDVLAMPGLGTGVGGVDPKNCARQVAAAWDEVFGTRVPDAR
jgi:O-acetyl-ADP-ribose deacetylase (regulator of RNase III)